MNGPRGVAASGSYVYVVGYDSDSLAVIDVSSPTSPSVVGSVIDSTNINGATGVAVSGSYVYVAGHNTDSLAVVRAPTHPPSHPQLRFS